MDNALFTKPSFKELRATLPDTLPAGIVKFNDSWHLGVIGIVAGVISADTGRPTLVFAGTGDGHWRGSGRAPDGWDLFALIQEIDKNNPGLLLGFGGHAAPSVLTLNIAVRNIWRNCLQALVPPQKADKARLGGG